ncbi:YlaF family protein [Bacillus sp. JCM 19034]|uniref:YlaF family protein n=1 Tax=Bacillus sp. JCM 19034 TaxID=1481928 RepID=UPI000781B8AB|nr:YlaF family protein [Bacillus sp. JCM 19034]
MKKENFLFLLLAIITVVCIMSIGVAVAEKSMLIFLLAVAGIIIAMGLGFTLKKKVRESVNKEPDA